MSECEVPPFPVPPPHAQHCSVALNEPWSYFGSHIPILRVVVGEGERRICVYVYACMYAYACTCV